MIKEAINRIVELADKTKTHIIDSKTYVDGELTLLAPPEVPSFKLMTLQGVIDVVAAQPSTFDPKAWLVDVVSFGRVIIRAREGDGFGRRAVLADCELADVERFPFGQFLDRESFVIGLSSRFVDTRITRELLALVSNLSNEGVTQSEDDGVSQKTTVKQGIVLKTSVTVRPRWMLNPYRTFREITQPPSYFVLRLRAEPGQVPKCALFEADGGAWKLDAVLSIKHWLAHNNIGLPIVA